jgi:hypothetical protein
MTKRRPPWGKLLGKPIERSIALSKIDDWSFGTEESRAECRKDIEREAFAEQFQKLCRLKKHYGIQQSAGWYELALALAREFDCALTITDPTPPRASKTARHWRGASGLLLLEEIEALRKRALRETPARIVTDESLLAEHQLISDRYRDMKPEHLKANYYQAKSHHNKSKKRTAK